VPAIVNEMLVQTHEKVLFLSPVWPKHRPARFERLRAEGAFLVSSELRNGMVQQVKIESEKGKDCTMRNPWPGVALLVQEVMVNGRRVVTPVESHGANFTFKTRPRRRHEAHRGR
jgi:hypothetical protein